MFDNYIDSIGIKAAEKALDRKIEPSEYMAVHVAVQALMDSLVLLPAVTWGESADAPA